MSTRAGRLASLILATLVAAGCAGVSLGPTGTPAACPAALLGPVRVLIDVDGVSTLAVPDIGARIKLRWPEGYELVPDAPGGAQVVDEAGRPVVRVGERVWVGGGFSADDTEFNACGGVTREDPAQ